MAQQPNTTKPLKEYYVESLECQTKYGNKIVQEQKRDEVPKYFDAENDLLFSKINRLADNMESANYKLEWHTPVKDDRSSDQSQIRTVLKPGNDINIVTPEKRGVQKKLKEFQDRIYFDLNRIQTSFLKESPTKMTHRHSSLLLKEAVFNKEKLYDDLHKQLSTLGKPTKSMRNMRVGTHLRDIYMDDIMTNTTTTTKNVSSRPSISFLKPGAGIKFIKCRINTDMAGANIASIARCKSEAGVMKKILTRKSTAFQIY